MKEDTLQFIGGKLTLYYNFKEYQVGEFDPFDNVNSIVKTIAKWAKNRLADLFTLESINFNDTTFDSNNKISAFKGYFSLSQYLI